MLARLASLALLTLTLVALLPDCASACSCAALPGTPQERAGKALSGSTAVFSGEVVEFEKPPPATTMIEGTMMSMMGGGGPEATATLRVSEVWKGPRQQTMTVTTEADSGVGCGYPFEDGREYLVYATGDERSVSLCSETKPLSEARADLGALGDGASPEDGGALSDTSGGISVRAVALLAGLVMAGSLLLAMRLLNTG
ncbi:MAG: hypothetical protein AVDCRST_MAG03-3714 [uncultured Rubrobacteraceae bacterium]|uniref:CbiN domain protein n=1 Tax=uncultured Rubrobacteraceae bacterium TaxID=349277 RepID=A0A6J4QE08_9ACTN|nr:MAG: hypothetical protein AVDCRST_MAG03-3714 [uncultured Rubrobacteraceae bacterium]